MWVTPSATNCSRMAYRPVLTPVAGGACGRLTVMVIVDLLSCRSEPRMPSPPVPLCLCAGEGEPDGLLPSPAAGGGAGGGGIPARSLDHQPERVRPFVSTST